MPRRIDPKPCACRCGTTNETWAPGHDQKLRVALEKALEAHGAPNGLMALRDLVEWKIKRQVIPALTPHRTARHLGEPS